MSDEFEFGVGDTVLVRHRENGTSGKIKAKFEATVERFGNADNDLVGTFAVLRLPFDQTVNLRYYEAEFEILETANDGEPDSGGDAELATDGGEIMEDTGEFLEKLDQVSTEAREAYEEDDLERCKEKLAAINNNVGEILMRVNIEMADRDDEPEELAADGGNGIEPLAEEHTELDLGEFVEVAERKANGEDIPGFIPEDDLDLVRISATFLDESGISREFSLESDGFDPDEYGEVPEEADPQ